MTSTKTPTLTPTYTPSPVPVYARIGPETGAMMRSGPGFDAPEVYPGVMQGVLVQLMGDPQEAGGFLWVPVLVVEDGRQGWIMQSLLDISTPEPNW